ncbi:MAG: hypothetical protein D6763_12210 [Alphaproteobacteria bacterium]|nr:MAG: hypothetical protein D6763_12210 [Alphaproteobacteria bacterium]
MKQAIKRLILHIARALGLFALARRLTADRLRILGYHGGSLRDEHVFSPGTFMTRATFAGRLQFLVDRGYPVLSLDDALEKLEGGTLPANATVITIDDGWYGTLVHMVPELEARGFPATLYMSTYYMEKGTQVFNMYLAYLLSRPAEGLLDLSSLGSDLSGHYDLGTPYERRAALTVLRDHGESRRTAEQRQDLLRRLSEVLGIDWQEAEAARLFTYMTPAEVASLPERGIALELHTHRHPEIRQGSEIITREIEDNRAALGRVVAGPFTHYCYPSGFHDPSHYPYLAEAGIKSATTTDAGLVRRNSHRYVLPRILDSQELSLIEFEAEMCGFLDLLRGARGGTRSLSGS